MGRAVAWALLGYGVCAVVTVVVPGFNGFMTGLCLTIVTAAAGG